MTRRRHLLATLAGGLAAGVAGCGYRPAGREGDIRWRSSQTLRTRLRGWIPDTTGVVGDLLVSVFDMVREYDFGRNRYIHNGAVCALEADTGEERWRDILPATVSDSRLLDDAPTAVSASTLGDPPAVGTTDAAYGYRVDGERWAFNLESASVDIAAAGGHVYVLTAAGTLRAVRRGNQRWQRDIPVPAPGPEPRLLADDRGVAVLEEGTLRRFGPDGSERWTRPTPAEVRRVHLAGDRLFLSTRLRTTAVAVETGRTRWVQDTPVESVDTTGRGVYAVSDGAVLARSHSGVRRWRVEGGPARDESDREGGGFDSVVADETGVYVTTDSSVAELDPSDGGVRWSVSYDSVTGGPFVTDAGVIVQSGGSAICHYTTDG